jgi:hypothetical protein
MCVCCVGYDESWASPLHVEGILSVKTLTRTRALLGVVLGVRWVIYACSSSSSVFWV